MKVLVTGGEGFIGSHVADALAMSGCDVSSLDNESALSNLKFYKENERVKYYCFSILDYKQLSSLFQENQFEMVFHLAAESRIQPAIQNPSQACSTNFVGTQNLLEVSRLTKVKRFIYSSTSSCYGIKNTGPLREDMPTDCLNSYSISKVAGEGLCRVYYNIYGLETVSLRYFNVYGERHPIKGQYAPVVGKFLLQKKNGEPMSIVGDGSQRRDFTYVQDVVKSNLLAMRSKNASIFGEVFNVGSGVNYSILQIAKIMNGDYVYVPKRPGEAQNSLSDISKIRRELNYEPEVKIEDWIKSQL